MHKKIKIANNKRVVLKFCKFKYIKKITNFLITVDYLEKGALQIYKK